MTISQGNIKLRTVLMKVNKKTKIMTLFKEIYNKKIKLIQMIKLCSLELHHLLLNLICSSSSLKLLKDSK